MKLAVARNAAPPVVLLFVVTIAACGGNATPSGPAATTIEDLLGNWSATVVTASNSCYPFTWSPTLGAGGLTGPLGPENIGALTGTFSNGTVAFSLNVPAGSVGQNTCAATGSGNARASQTEIIGQDFRLDFTPACVGILMAPTSNDFTQFGTLTMRKSGQSPPTCPADSRIFD